MILPIFFQKNLDKQPLFPYDRKLKRTSLNRYRETGKIDIMTPQRFCGNFRYGLANAGLFFLSVFSDWSALAPAFTLLFDRAGQERKKLQKAFLFVTAVVGINEAASVAQTEGVLGFPEGAVRVLFSMTGPALAGLCILYGYNGERAKKGRQVLKWFFYGFYPLHLLLLWLAARAMGTM